MDIYLRCWFSDEISLSFYKQMGIGKNLKNGKESVGKKHSLLNVYLCLHGFVWQALGRQRSIRVVSVSSC